MTNEIPNNNVQPAKSKGGRPTKFKPELVKRILGCLRRGMPLTLAARAAGISDYAFKSYRTRFPEFAGKVEVAIAQGVERRLQKIEDASEAGDWRAAAWLLEHCQPEHFARNRVEVTGADGSPLTAAVAFYLPQKDGVMPTVQTNPPKQLKSNENT